MPWLDVIWTDENEEHIADAGLTKDDVENALRNPIGAGKSESSGRPYIVGPTLDRRDILVVYEEVDAITAYPVTAYFL